MGSRSRRIQILERINTAIMTWRFGTSLMTYLNIWWWVLETDSQPPKSLNPVAVFAFGEALLVHEGRDIG